MQFSSQYIQIPTNYYPLYGSFVNPPETSIFFDKQNKITRLENLYYFHNPDEIKRFLLTHDYLIEHLFEAYDQIRRIFGENVEIHLEYTIDPEEDWDELFIVIKSPYPAEKAVELERKLFDEWFVHIMDKLNNKLNFIEEPL